MKSCRRQAAHLQLLSKKQTNSFHFALRAHSVQHRIRSWLLTEQWKKRPRYFIKMTGVCIAFPQNSGTCSFKPPGNYRCRQINHVWNHRDCHKKPLSLFIHSQFSPSFGTWIINPSKPEIHSSVWRCSKTPHKVPCSVIWTDEDCVPLWICTCTVICNSRITCMREFLSKVKTWLPPLIKRDTHTQTPSCVPLACFR